jgi:hypothetical protein
MFGISPCRVEMDPVDFQIIFTHLEKASSGNPSIYELYIKSISRKKQMNAFMVTSDRVLLPTKQFVGFAN